MFLPINSALFLTKPIVKVFKTQKQKLGRLSKDFATKQGKKA